MRQNAFLILLAALTFSLAQYTRAIHEKQQIAESEGTVYAQEQINNQKNKQKFGEWGAKQNAKLKAEERKAEVYSFADIDDNSQWPTAKKAENEDEYKASRIWGNLNANGNAELLQSKWETGWLQQDWPTLWDKNGDGI